VPPDGRHPSPVLTDPFDPGAGMPVHGLGERPSLRVSCARLVATARVSARKSASTGRCAGLKADVPQPHRPPPPPRAPPSPCGRAPALRPPAPPLSVFPPHDRPLAAPASQAELRAGEEIARCPSCSLQLLVVYNPDDFQEEEATPGGDASAGGAPVAVN